MSKFIKVICLVIALSMILSMGLVGCSGNDGEESGESGSKTGGAPVDPVTNEPLKPVTLHWYNVSSEIIDPGETDKVVAEANKTLKEKLNVTLKYNLIDSGSFDDKINVKFSGGEPIDLCYASLGWLNKYPIGVSSGKFLELDDLLNKYGKNIKAATAERFWESAKVKGKIYCIMNVQNYAFGQGVMFQKSLVEELGVQQDIDNLKYMEDLTDLLAKVKAKFDADPKYSKLTVMGNPPNMPTKKQEAEQETIPGTVFAVMRGDADLNVIVGHTTDWGRYGLKVKRDWFEKGYISREAAVIKEWTSVFRKGKVFATSCDGTKPGIGEEQSLRLGMPVVIKETRSPVLKTGDILASLTVISKNSKNPERAMMLADLMFTDIPTYNTLVWGINGVHYTKVDDRTIKLTDQQRKYNPMNHWAAGNTFNAYLTDQEDANRWEETKKRNETSGFETTFGFVLDVSKYPSEYSQMAEITSRHFRQMNSGLVDVDVQLDKLQKELDNLGYQKLYDDVKEQMQKFKESKAK